MGKRWERGEEDMVLVYDTHLSKVCICSYMSACVQATVVSECLHTSNSAGVQAIVV